MTKTRSNVLALLLGIVIAAALLAISETVLRAVRHAREVKAERSLKAPWAKYTYKEERGIRSLDGKKIDEFSYRYDDLRRRVTPDQPSGAKRYLLAFGCSYMFGEMVKEDETLPYQLSRHLRGVHVYNYGVRGAGPHGILDRMRDSKLRREVAERDGAMIYLFLEDHVKRAAGAMSIYWGRKDPYYELDERGELRRLGTFRTVRPMTSRLYDWLHKSELVSALGLDFPKITDHHRELTAKLIEAMRDEYVAQFKNDRFYVATFPRTGDSDVVRRLRERGIKILDLSHSQWRQSPAGKTLAHSNDSHPTPRTHEYVGGELARLLKETGF